MPSDAVTSSRSGRRRKGGNHIQQASHTPSIAALSGGLSPLTLAQCQIIHDSALTILGDIGLSDAPDEVIHLLTPKGAKLTGAGRLLIPASLIEQTMSDLPKTFTLHGRKSDYGMPLGEGYVYLGSGGASPQVLEYDDNGNIHYRPSQLIDLYDAARLVDALPHIHFFSRSLVAGDISDAKKMDINTAYACFSGTAKPILTSASSKQNADAVIAMAYAIAGSEDAFRQQPFFAFNINHAVPPLRFDPASCQVIITAAKAGVPVMINTFGQLGASSPVTIAGCLAQTMAETLAGMVIAWAANPNAKAVFGPRPMITDLRTGGMSGGSGEQALLTAAAAQMAQFYGWPCSTIAGATDSKALDAQSGYEKALNVTLAVEAGIDMVTQAAGAQASLMAASMAGYVLDNDMLGAIIQASQKPQINTDTLALDDIRAVVLGEGHFLGLPATLARMKSDFTYPVVANRTSIEEWQASGSTSIDQRARIKAAEILAETPNVHIPADIDQQLRDSYDICLTPRTV